MAYQVAWKVRLFEARTQDEFSKSGVAANFIEIFGVQASGPDEAKRAARQWLTVRGHNVRSINVSAADERTLFAYVAAGSVEAAAKKVASQ
jgi:hypothetical protein